MTSAAGRQGGVATDYRRDSAGRQPATSSPATTASSPKVDRDASPSRRHRDRSRRNLLPRPVATSPARRGRRPGRRHDRQRRLRRHRHPRHPGQRRDLAARQPAASPPRGIVTGRKSNGFFLQASDAEADADPATSEGVFVFTSGAPPAAAAVGNRVRVRGTVDRVRAAAPIRSQLPLTEIGGSPTVSAALHRQPLPAPVALTAAFPDPAGALDQLERLEGMRVTVPALTVVAPTDGSSTSPTPPAPATASSTSSSPASPRPFREPGIQAPDPPPAAAASRRSRAGTSTRNS